MIKYVLFDVDDTIIDFRKSAELCFQRFSDKYGWGISGVDVCECFYSTTLPMWKEVDKGTLTGRELRRIRWPMVFKNLGLKVEGEETFEETFREGIGEAAIPIPNSKEVLEALSKKYTIGIASNAYLAQQSKRLELLDYKKYIKYYFTSMDIGTEKPHREFYEHCLREMGNPDPDSVIMIGDSPTADVQGAKNMGLKTCFFNKRGLDPTLVDADYIIDDLKELLDIL